MSTCPVVDGKMKFSDLEAILKSETGEELQQEEIDLIQKSISEDNVTINIRVYILRSSCQKFR